MSCVLRTVLIASVASGSAWGKTELDGLRQSATEARQRVAELRARQSAQQKQLDDLAPRIESLKQQSGMVPGGELKEQLRRSQDLSSQLTAIAQALASAEVESQRRDSQLLAGLSAELQRLETAWDQSGSRQKRALLIVQVQALKEEREKLRSSKPLRDIPSVQPSRVSEEPEDLRRQFDSLRDSEDKVKQQLSAVESRISEVRDERALDRRMNEFLREQSLFDEQDRSYRLTPEQSAFQGAPTLGGARDSPNPN